MLRVHIEVELKGKYVVCPVQANVYSDWHLLANCRRHIQAGVLYAEAAASTEDLQGDDKEDKVIRN